MILSFFVRNCSLFSSQEEFTNQNMNKNAVNDTYLSITTKEALKSKLFVRLMTGTKTC